MKWNQHFERDPEHALLSPSHHTWLNYDEEKLYNFTMAESAQERGTLLHAHAANCIKLGTPLAETDTTLGMYVNDCIKFNMDTEIKLRYSENCFGRADAIDYLPRKKMLKIFDLKTGVTPAHMEQLEIYAALFCLEYRHKPEDLTFELRIYQNNDIYILNPKPEDIRSIMNIIVEDDRKITKWKNEDKKEAR